MLTDSFSEDLIYVRGKRCFSPGRSMSTSIGRIHWSIWSRTRNRNPEVVGNIWNTANLLWSFKRKTALDRGHMRCGWKSLETTLKGSLWHSQGKHAKFLSTSAFLKWNQNVDVAVTSDGQRILPLGSGEWCTVHCVLLLGLKKIAGVMSMLREWMLEFCDLV